MNEVRNFSWSETADVYNFLLFQILNIFSPVDSLNTISDTPSHGTGSTWEDSDLAHVAVLLLDELEEGGHVRSAKVIDGLETSEHGAVTEALEVVLTDVEHGGPQVKLVEELSDKNMHFEHVRNIFTLHVS